MRIEEFDYDLPRELIAQRPLERRDASRLLVLDRESQTFSEKRFTDLPSIFNARDLLVVNDTVVRPLRLRGLKKIGGKVEVTLVGRLPGPGRFECMVKMKNPKPGAAIEFEGGRAVLIEESENSVRTDASSGAPLWAIEFEGEPDELISREGLPPLPPYIRRGEDDDPEPDKLRYQTVYARRGEAAAAPTAGLHFTGEVMDELSKREIGMARVRLDVSFGTFAPVKAGRVEDHVMHPELYELSRETADAVNAAKDRGSRVAAVGTTVVRTLEHAAGAGGRVEPGRGESALYIYPGFDFKVVDAMVTNFHMPRSTLILLVAAFAGKDLILRAYQHAVKEKFRFLSYGDSMVIL